MRDFRMRIAGVNHFTWFDRGGSEGAGCHEEVHEAIRAKGVTEKGGCVCEIFIECTNQCTTWPICVRRDSGSAQRTPRNTFVLAGIRVHVEEEPAPPLKLF